MDRMKDYRQLIKELPSTTLVCALGDFDPPTTAHELLVKTVNRLSEQKNTDHVIYASTKDSLIQEEKKEQYLKLMFPKTKFKSVNESKISNLLEELSKKYKKIIIVAGSEQVAGLKKLVKENTQIIAINEKNPDSNYTKMKQLAVKGLYEEFKKKLPSTIRELDGRRLMNDVRVGLGLDPVKEQLVLVKDKLREQYFRGEIFNEGDIVESNGEQFTIVKRGSNHLLLKEQSGKLVSKWIQDVKPMEDKAMNEGVIQPNGTDKLDVSTSDTGAKAEPKPKGKVKGFITFYNFDAKDPIKESALNPADIHGDFQAKSKTLQDLSKDKQVDQQQVQQRKLDLEKEYALKKEKLKADHEKNKEKIQTEELEEAKKKAVCPTCGEHKCQCDTTVDKTSYNQPFDPFFAENITEEEIDEMVKSVTDEDIEDLYEEDELVLVYDDDGEEIPPLQEESKYDLMEVLSRTERMRGKIRLRKTSAKRGRSTKIALKRYSNPATINKRARRLAIKLMKKRMLRGRDYSKVSVGEKERIEKTLSQRKDVIGRIAQKLVSRVRKVEKARMSHGKVTKGTMPSVF
jgi:phosphopantetheine adenylyltransferase